MSDDLGTMFARAAEAVPTRIAIAMRDGVERSYAEVDERTSRLASALLGAGLEPGDRILAWMSDSLEYLELYVAAVRAGLVVVPINKLLTVAEAEFPARDSEPRALAFSADLADNALALADRCDLRLLLSVGATVDRAEDFESFLARGTNRRLPPVDEESLAIIGYTSGTTGRPKGAMLTHRSIKNIARMNAMSYRLVEGSACAFTGSMSFVATVPAHFFCHLYVRGTTRLMGRWEVDDLVDTIERHRITFTYIPTPRLLEFADAAERHPDRIGSLLTALHSGSKASPAHLRRLAEVIGDRLVEGLGMTENSGGLVTTTSAGDFSGDSEARDVFASVGRPALDAAVAVVDADGDALPHDGESIGELLFASPALMSGYWRNDDATVAALRGGWYRSGDLGSIDRAGYAYVSDRRTDLIVSGGLNIYPSEVEEAIVAHPDVVDVAVVGAPHERWGQTVVAVVVARPGAELDGETVIAHVRERIAAYKKPTRVVFVDELPRTASLKVKRHEVREHVLATNEP